MQITHEVQQLDPTALVSGRTVAKWLELAEFHQPKRELDMALLTELIEHYAWVDSLTKKAAATTLEALELIERIESEVGEYGK